MRSPLRRLALKELRESLRDRRTVVTLVLMPVLVYPVLGVLLRNVLIATNPTESGPVPVVLEDEDSVETFRDLFQAGTALLEGEGKVDTNTDPFDLELKIPPDLTVPLRERVRIGEAEVGVVLGRNDAPRFTLLTRAGSPLSQETARRIFARLRAVNDAALRGRLLAAGLDPEPPATFTNEAIEPEGGSAINLATVIPLILLLMTATGAVYPAIDTTAGERERGTLETLIAAPVSRLGLLTAKFVAVWAVAVLTAAANLIAMTATVYAAGLDAALFGDGVPWWSLPATAGLLVLTAGFFAAVLLAVTSAARSFKEAQAYLIPLMLCCLAPGGLALAPTVRLDLGWAAVPLVNLVLLAREVLGGTAPLLPALAAVLTTVCYAGLALSMAARIFGTDAILYGGPGGWGEFLKPERRPGGVPPVGAVVLGTLGCVAAFLILGSLPAKLAGVTDAASLATADLPFLLGLNAAVSVAVFVLLPWLIVRWSGGTARAAFALRTPAVLGLVGGLLIGLGAWAGVFELLLAFGAGDRLAGLDRFVELKDRLKSVPLPLVIGCLAVVPAVCEEVAFRGFVLTGLKDRFGAVRAVLASAVVFGLFHVVKELGLWERLVGSTLLGLALGWVRVRTGSLWPGVLLHAANNALILTVASYEERVGDWFGVEVSEGAHLPPAVLLTAAGLAAVGGICVWFAGRGRVNEPRPSGSVTSDLATTRNAP